MLSPVPVGPPAQITTHTYVGEGSVEGGHNDHSSTGAYNVFPGDNYKAHLTPFLDGDMNLESKTEVVFG